MPSIVVTVLPATDLQGVRQEKARLPSIRTEQAPHWASPQPYLVPVRCRSSRKTSSSGRVGSVARDWGLPLRVKATVSSMGHPWGTRSENARAPKEYTFLEAGPKSNVRQRWRLARSLVPITRRTGRFFAKSGFESYEYVSERTFC